MNGTEELSLLRHKTTLFNTAMLLFALMIGFVSAGKPMYPLALVGALLYGICLFTKPKWAYFLMILVIVNFFGFAPPGFMQVRGVFKLYDVCLLAQFIPLLIHIASDRSTLERVKSPSNKILILLMLFLGFVICYTVYEFQVSFMTTTRIPRKYLLYLSFFLFMYLFKDEDDLRYCLKVIFTLAAIQSALIVGQVILGPRLTIIPYLTFPIEFQYLSGLVVPRIYLPGGSPLMFFSFSIAFWMYVTGEKRGKFMFLVLLLGLGVFCEFYRTKWARELVVMAVPFIFATTIERRKLFLIMLLLTISAFVIIILMHFFGFEVVEKLERIADHAMSAYRDFINKSGTFAARLQTFDKKMIMFDQRPWLNLGFLHPLAATESSKAAFMHGILVESSDSEIITLATTMGIIGTTVFFGFGIYMVARCITVLRRVQNLFFRAILLGIFGHHIAGLVTFNTYSFLTNTEHIVFIALSLGLIEKINQIRIAQSLQQHNVAKSETVKS